MKSDHIKRMITLTGDNIKRLSLYVLFITSRQLQSQVRNRKVDGEGLEAPRQSPKPARALSDVVKVRYICSQV